VQIEQKNLFKYPPTEAELGCFQAVVFDPPRAGAKELCRVLAAAAPENKPAVLVAVSCSPQTFVNDANMLVEGGYKLEEVTMVDQFSYSDHSELVARFTKA
jgi:23S rRNA (uracil1939-C5)-methyltransferase